ncbi:MAG: alanine racemase [Phycisphaeraceae bacterium]
MTDTSWLEVDLVALRHNIKTWRQMLDRPNSQGGPARLCAVLKADAYGTGAGEVARCLDQGGADMFAVYSPAQAHDLLAHPITRPILILMPVRTKPETARLHHAMLAGQLHLSIDSPDQLVTVNSIGASYDCRVPIHLAVDSGMSRGGLPVEQLGAVLKKVATLRHVKLSGIWTHFAAADSEAEFTQSQLDLFQGAVGEHKAHIADTVLLHAAATHAALRDSKYHLDMVRIGLGLYGYGAPAWMTAARGFAGCHGSRRSADETRVDARDGSDFEDHLNSSDTGIFDAFETVDGHEVIQPQSAQLQPAIRWRSRIVHVRKYAAGATVGYGCTASLARDSYLGIVPVGYADGLPLALTNKGCVRLLKSRGQADESAIHAPIVGRVNMDQIIIDLTPARGGTGAPLAQLEDVVEIISDDPTSPCYLPALAAAASSSPYEVLCRISPRIGRVYTSTAPAAVAMASDRLKVSAV